MASETGMEQVSSPEKLIENMKISRGEKPDPETDLYLALIPETYLKDFKCITGYRHELYCDPDRYLYKALGCHDTPKGGPTRRSQHVKSGFFIGVLKSTWRGMKYREYQGDTNQQGGAFILGPGDTVDYQHRNLMPHDLVPINELLRTAGVEQVTFKKDAPVITI
ncbi:hypothetical protein LSH36_25g10100 [Paralvinella palmiformis]|uniref:Uncharacterized protein n=1 Tax=Paralvinella palmiformis TaxID=53620 RepID=A0AAD9K9R1_9ANNE|nr:hypothetical protein LSH36_25g10100 [Paralvinella palmiformis]